MEVHSGTVGTAVTGIANQEGCRLYLRCWRRLRAAPFSLRVAANSLTDESPVPVYEYGMTDSLDRLYQQVLSAKDADPSVSRTARLLRAGRGKVAKKMAEEAVEVVIDAMNGDREAVVRESADLLYNLVVLWVASDLRPADVWNEMKRREALMGIAEKLPKNGIDSSRRKVVLLDSRRSRKRR
jgi:phosphoribosyl-ATP pyrophosphohydrolase